MHNKTHPLCKVNIEEIDKAHLNHVLLLEALSDAIDAKNVTAQHIEIIKKSLESHFEYEEELMKRHNVPTLIKHKKAHKDMTYKFDEALEHIRIGDSYGKCLYVEYLKELFLCHVELWDAQYVPYINEEVAASASAF